MYVNNPVPVPKGTPEYEAKRAAVLKALADKVPAEFCLGPEFFKDTPLDVSKIPAACGLLTDEEVAITEGYDATGLAEAIARRKYTSVAVARAFCKRAIIAHQLTSCLTQWYYDEAIQQATKLDEYLAEHGTTIGPLHGVPVSVKDHVPLAGTFSSLGILATAEYDQHDSPLPAVLRKAGAVFYCKTNQPQALMHGESDSPWGRALNPYNTTLTPGGSSGGEGALIAMKGSILGIGTDIGGSIRIPAAFSGIYGYKPTSGILSTRDMVHVPMVAELTILANAGPMCRSARDMDLFMRVQLDAKPYIRDLTLVPTTWAGLSTQLGVTLGRPLKVGIMTHDGFIQPQPPLKRALSWASTLLSDPRLSGLIEIKSFLPYGVKQCWDEIRQAYSPDGGIPTHDAILATGEPIYPLTEWIWRPVAPKGMLTAGEMAYVRKACLDFRHSFAEDWERQDVDVILCPTGVGPATTHDTNFYLMYTALWNYLDCPGLVFPTGLKVEEGEKYDADYKPLGPECAHVKELWESGNFQGAPINLQLVGRRYHDNQLFGALKLLQDALGLE
ncbi:amidase signature domain-containing protein [Fusarium oxysporum Fo47]|uniref:amidase n=1 Tax=Fusarium oxysporum Fo47 TaxID=660027 RepID=W9KID2_FUSOX|nr:amidase signature domain-containing protein [Fusarium oxysporum Fo47]EWZ41053.1 hypothetical protein FOZG_06471 [Fusarium oxysporum Fo47]QKD52285.1 amidase signature domain-containing protein [Fusarium oxysporum Fo47]